MRWTKIKETFFDHPFFEYAERRDCILSEAQAELVLRAGYPSFEEMIEAAKTRFSDEPVSWSIFDEALAARRAKQRNSSRENEGVLVWLNGHRRFAAAALAILLLLAFFTLVPAGRALAEDLFNMVARIVGERIEFINQNSDANKPNGPAASVYEDGETMEYNSFDEFHTNSGYAPFVLQADWFECHKIASTYIDGYGFMLESTYETGGGYSIYVAQIWGMEEGSNIKNEENLYCQASILNDKTLYYAVDSKDGRFTGAAILENSVLYIGAENGIDVNQLLDAMR